MPGDVILSILREATQRGRDIIHYHENGDQQKRALDKLVDEKYNQIHEDAFNKIAGLDGRPSTTSRLKDVIQRLWWDKNRHMKIIKGLESQVKNALETCERQRKQLEIQAGEIKKMRASKGDYGQV